MSILYRVTVFEAGHKASETLSRNLVRQVALYRLRVRKALYRADLRWSVDGQQILEDITRSAAAPKNMSCCIGSNTWDFDVLIDGVKS